MKLRYSLMLGALLILAGTSCEDKLDIPQKGVLDFSTYYKTDEQAQAAADALYIQLKGTYYNYTMMKNALSDDVWQVVVVVMTMQSWKAVMNIHLAQTKVLSEAYGKATISLFIRRM